MRIYHGSEFEIVKPEYGKGKLYNDYGRGFYCTEDADMGREWSVEENRDGILNSYELDADELNILNLNSEKYSIINWLAILLDNRSFDIQTDFAKEARNYILDNFCIDYRKYDVIRGYRADDRYFAFAQDFLNNAISLRTLEYAMKLGNMGEQVVLISPQSFEKISHICSEKVSAKTWYPKKKHRDKEARDAYSLKRNEPWKRGETYILQIMEEGMTNADIII